MEYNCDCCKYTTDKRFNYEKHLTSKKHRVADENIKKQLKNNIESTQSQQLVNPKSTQKVTLPFLTKYRHKIKMFVNIVIPYFHVNNLCTDI